MKHNRMSRGGYFFMSVLGVALAASLFYFSGVSASASLVKDINPGISGSNASWLTLANGDVYFRADDGVHGRELWKTDGTESGTYMVKDINPGSGQSAPSYFAQVRDAVVFQANDGGHGWELWRTDGTESGTYLLKDIYVGVGNSSPSYFYEYNGRLYFSAKDSIHGTELWVTDGTEEGTQLLKDINPGYGDSYVATDHFTEANGELYFRANDGVHGIELWKTDGTEEGTVMIKDIQSGQTSAYITNITNVNGTVFFVADYNGQELWKTDGTEEGTVMVKDINPGVGSSRATHLTALNGELYLRADDGVHGYELWKSDGTAEGTMMVKDIIPGDVSGLGGSLTPFGNYVYFQATDGVHGYELWKSDGTAEGTMMVKDIFEGSSSYSSAPNNFVVANNTLYFGAATLEYGTELWKTDGTEEGTILAADIKEGPGTSQLSELVNMGEKLIFKADDGIHGLEIFMYEESTPPVIAHLVATPRKDGSGQVELQSTVSDEEGASVSIVYAYEAGVCGSYASQPSPTIGDIVSAIHDQEQIVMLNNNITNVSTASGENMVVALWDSKTDAPEADGTYCVYAYADDGSGRSEVLSTTVVLDNVAPDAPVITDWNSSARTLEAIWSSVDDAVFYTVSSTAGETATTTETSYAYIELIPNTSFDWQIMATDDYGNAGVYGPVASQYTIPAKPKYVSAVANGQTAVNLAWSPNDNPDNTVYKIYNVTKHVVMGSTTGTFFTLTGFAPETKYKFTVRAIYNSDHVSYVESSETPTVETAPMSRAITMHLRADGATPSYRFLGRKDEYTAEITRIANGYATLSLHSDPVVMTLAAGESAHVDTTGDGKKDTLVTMDRVTNEEATFTLIAKQGGSTDNSGKEVGGTVPRAKGDKAVLINKGKSTTDSQKVELTFDAQDAVELRISDDPEFPTVAFEKYTHKKDWVLTDGNGLKTLYVEFKSKDGLTAMYSASITLEGQTADDENAPKIAEEEMNHEEKVSDENGIEDYVDCGLDTQRAYKTQGDRAVYYVTPACTKRVFRNANIFFTYFDSWRDVTVVDAEALDAIPNDKLPVMLPGAKYEPGDGSLVKTTEDTKVYLLMGGQKYWIASEDVFNTFKYKWEWVEDIDKSLLQRYTDGENIESEKNRPNGTLVRYENDTRVYKLEADPTDDTKQVKRYISDFRFFDTGSLRLDRIVTIGEDEVYPDGEDIRVGR